VRIVAFLTGGHRSERPARPRIARGDTVAALLDGRTKAASELVVGDLVRVEAGCVIPCDGTVIEGTAMVDESAITGESAPVLRDCASDRNAVIAGTRVLSSRIVMRV